MYGYYGFYWDPTYYLVVIGAIICLIASARVKGTFNRYNRVRSASGMTGAQAAEHMLRRSGIYDVTVARVSGNLTDHYAPKEKVLRLSDSVYDSTSIAALGVAAHETGHAMQHAQGYAPLEIRNSIVPLVNFGSSLSMPLLLAGLHLCFAFPFIHKLLILFNLDNRGLLIGTTAVSFAVFAVLYAIVYKLTGNTYYRIVAEDTEKE